MGHDGGNVSGDDRTRRREGRFFTRARQRVAGVLCALVLAALAVWPFGADALASRDWQGPISSAQQAIQEYFDFDADDVATNRAGGVNLHQYPVVYPLFVGFFGVLMLVIGVAGLRQGETASKVFGVLMFAAGGGLLLYHRHIFIDVVSGKSCQVVGSPTTLEVTSFKGHRTWHFELEGVELSFEERDGRPPIDPLLRYRFYYLCRSRKLLSAEVITDSGGSP